MFGTINMAPKTRGRPKKPRNPNDDGKPHNSWDFTDWKLFDEHGNINEDRLAAWQLLSRDDMSTKLMIAKEQAPETGKWHGQGRITMRRKYRFDAISKILCCHVGDTKAPQDWAYFAKIDSDPLIIDQDNRKPGRRKIFDEQKDAIKDGANIRQCIEMEGANYQSVRTAELLMKYIEPARSHQARQVVVKHKLVVPTDAYVVTNKFWDGYDGHREIVIVQSVARFTMPELRLLLGPASHRVSRGRQSRWDTVYLYGCTTDELKSLNMLDRALTPSQILGLD